jgi:uncharacterized membrane protein YfcA
MDHLIALLLFATNAITCVRLFLYRREGARYRPVVSIAAWLLIASTGSTALGIVLGQYPPPDIHVGDLGISLVLCVLGLTARGNVAAILRTTNHEPAKHPAHR